jgi:cell division protease FtsH
MIISDQEKKVTATHESGHTLIAKLLPGTDPVHKVTIIPRGPALGLMQQLPAEDRYNASRAFALDRIAIALGGRLAEEIVFNEITSGASNDIEVATDLARRMVCEWGMSEALGPLAFGKKEEQIFLGREISSHQDYSEQTAMAIDSEVRRIVTEQYQRAKQILLDNLDSLTRLSDALLEYETLDGAEINTILGGGAIQREKPVKRPAPASAKPVPERKEKKKILDALEGLGKLGGEPTKA